MVRGTPAGAGHYILTHAALRGVAAFLVVAYHLQFADFHRLAIETETPFFARCYLLVDLFFILSGFIISYTRETGSMRVMKGREVYDFYVARIARVYPLHLFCLFISVVLTLLFGLVHGARHAGKLNLAIDSAGEWSFVAELFLVQSWIPGTPRWNIPSWSISAEMFSYLLFPLVLFARHHLPRPMSWLMLALPIGFYGAVLGGTESLDIIAGLAPLRCLSGFFLGMILCEHRHWTARWSDSVIALSQGAGLAGSITVLATRCPDPLIIPFFTLIVFSTWQDRGPLHWLLVRRPLLRSGELSYSVYLTHVELIGVAIPMWYAVTIRIPLPPDEGRIIYIVGCFAAIVVVSNWTHSHIEQQGRRVVRRLLRRI